MEWQLFGLLPFKVAIQSFRHVNIAAGEAACNYVSVKATILNRKRPSGLKIRCSKPGLQ